MSKLFDFILLYRKLVVLTFVLIALFSFFAYKNSTVDAIPDIGENQQIVFTEWAGRSPQDIEDQITYPLSSALQGIPGVKEIRSLSAFGFSTIYLIFNENVELYWSRSRVLEKLTTVNSILPPGATATLGPDATGLGQIYWYGLENDPSSIHPKSLAELRSIQDFYVKFHLQGVKGVSEVASIGGMVKEYQIDIDPRNILAFDIHITDIIKAVQNSNLDVGAEVIEEGDREFVLRGRGFFKSLDDIKNVVVKVKDNTPVRIKDLATVSIGPKFRRGVLDRDGEEIVGGVVTMRFGENPKKVIEGLKEKLENIKAGLPKGVVLKSFYDRTELIERTTHTIFSALTQEIMITILVILIFLLHFRSSILVSLTLPFGVGISFILMYFFKIDSNIMSLSGMAIAIGAMVDMGIIMTENIHSHLSNSRDENRIDVIKRAANEVGRPILTAVLTTIVTFLPVFALEGASGKLFAPLAWAKTLAMFGSVVVALVLIPPLSSYLLAGDLKPLEENKVSTKIVSLYQIALSWVLQNRLKFLILPFIILLFGWYSYSKIGKEFMPSLNEGEILYMPVTTPDVSLSKAKELLSYTDQKLKEHPLVESAIGKLGRADTPLDPASISMLETIVKLKPKEKWPKGYSIYDVIQDLDQSLQIPGLVNSWDFPIQTRIGMISTGIKTQIGIKIYGDDLHTLESLALKVSKVVKTVPGATSVYAEQITSKPYLEFHVNRQKASRYGINVGTVNKVLQTAVGGMAIGEFYEGRERYPIRVRYKKEFRNRIDELKRILIPSPLGSHIPLEELADIKVTTGPAVIQSDNGILRSIVLLNVFNRDIIGFVEEAKNIVKEKIKLPPGYSIEWQGQYKNEVKVSKKLKFLIPLALLINLLIIYTSLRSFVHSIIVFSAIPIAMSGGLILLWAGGFNASVAVWIGFIALFGIAVDDGVVMMSFLKEEYKKSPPKSLVDLNTLILNAGKRRIRPLFMTTMTTVISLLPIMWSTGTGAEIMRPMAIPTLGGMTVELITLFIVPILYSLIEQRRLT